MPSDMKWEGGYRTGFCAIGQHEGTQPKSKAGKALKVCTMIDLCQCPCHANCAALFALTNTPRVVMGNPNYESFVPEFWMPTFEDLQTIRREASPQKLDEDGEPIFAQSASGRAARGQLEWEVNKIVTDLDSLGHVWTPRTIGEAIRELRGEGQPPSQGAIHSVLIRWAKIGYCTVKDKPFRFDGLTVAGMRDGLDKLKAKS